MSSKPATARARVLVCLAALLAPAAASSSALFTQGAGDVQSHVAGNAKESVVLLTDNAPAEETRPLATVWHTTTGERARTVVSWFERPGASSSRSAELNLVGLERLYEHLLQKDPAGTFELHRFELAARPGKTVGVKIGSTQGEVLRWIAGARQRAVADLRASGSALRPVAWSVATIEPAAASAGEKPDADRVSVRVVDATRRPIAGATLTAARGDHMLCSAQSDSRGLASCKLMDAHGHAAGVHDEEDHATPVIVTFGGVVTAQRIDLPTTRLFEPGPANGRGQLGKRQEGHAHHGHRPGR